VGAATEAEAVEVGRSVARNNLFKAAVGCNGSVYLTIPGQRAGEGKVQLSINNSVREYSAVTDGDTLRTGAQIRVVEVLSPDTVLVEPLESIII
jgi:N-acetylglutamate synthase/N-acetylornithine aminotransferase